MLSVAAHCARGTSELGAAVVEIGKVLRVESTVTRVVMDNSLPKLSSILT